MELHEAYEAAHDRFDAIAPEPCNVVPLGYYMLKRTRESRLARNRQPRMPVDWNNGPEAA